MRRKEKRTGCSKIKCSCLHQQNDSHTNYLKLSPLSSKSSWVPVSLFLQCLAHANPFHSCLYTCLIMRESLPRQHLAQAIHPGGTQTGKIKRICPDECSSSSIWPPSRDKLVMEVAGHCHSPASSMDSNALVMAWSGCQHLSWLDQPNNKDRRTYMSVSEERSDQQHIWLTLPRERGKGQMWGWMPIIPPFRSWRQELKASLGIPETDPYPKKKEKH